MAYDHLFAYCCDNDLYPDAEAGYCDLAPSEVYLESPYLFDHLLDVGLRHLDASSAYPGEIIDPSAVEWSNLFSTHPEKPLTPLFLEAQYKKYWSLTHVPLFQDEAGSLSNYLPLYTTSGFSLRDKYYNLCFVLKTAYETVLQPDSQKWPVVIGDQSQDASFYTACMNLVSQKVTDERAFTQSTLFTRAASTMQTSMESYTMTSFVQDRLLPLFDKLKAIVSLFGKIANQAPVSKRCAQ